MDIACWSGEARNVERVEEFPITLQTVHHQKHDGPISMPYCGSKNADCRHELFQHVSCGRGWARMVEIHRGERNCVMQHHPVLVCTARRETENNCRVQRGCPECVRVCCFVSEVIDTHCSMIPQSCNQFQCNKCARSRELINTRGTKDNTTLSADCCNLELYKDTEKHSREHSVTRKLFQCMMPSCRSISGPHQIIVRTRGRCTRRAHEF